MPPANLHDAIIVGAGPNGMAAAITLIQKGHSVLVLEAQDQWGGSAKTAEITLPGFLHDTCSAVHPLAVGSPFLRTLPLKPFGLKWIHPPLPLAHPFENALPALLHRSLDATAKTLDPADQESYLKLFSPFVANWEILFEGVLGLPHFPKHPFFLAKFGRHAIRSAEALARHQFKGPRARGLFAGLAAHSFLPLSQSPSSAIGLVLAIAAHSVGWPIPEGGSQKISDALVGYFKSLGGEIQTGKVIRSARDLPRSKVTLFDLTFPNLLRSVGDAFPPSYQQSLKKWKGSPAVFKMDWALSQPIPWKDPSCALAGTVHLGGTLEEIARSEALPWIQQVSKKPYVLLAQPSLFDTTRAPRGQQTVWAYCHVPLSDQTDYSSLIENQIERFAPGFKNLILSKSISSPADIERRNANLVGGDITGGIGDLRQFVIQPFLKRDPYALPHPGWYLCSSSAPPGPGVHGMCGFYAAQSALKKLKNYQP